MKASDQSRSIENFNRKMLSEILLTGVLVLNPRWPPKLPPNPHDTGLYLPYTKILVTLGFKGPPPISLIALLLMPD
jgi:hypothetical protein